MRNIIVMLYCVHERLNIMEIHVSRKDTVVHGEMRVVKKERLEGRGGVWCVLVSFSSYFIKKKS